MPDPRSIAHQGAHPLLVAAALVIALLPRTAHAQQTRTEREQFVQFDDELLGADVSAPYGTQIFPPHLPPARTLLIRPRTNFVPELYKSVEQI